MSSSTKKPVFVIGDVHGSLDRLEALLRKEGIVDVCPKCKGGGDDSPSDPFANVNMCDECDGDGITRLRNDVVVVQLGDLGHFGSSSDPYGKMIPGSSMSDLLCYQYGQKWLDVVLWGNHDRTVIDKYHEFTGYIPPPVETFRIMQALRDEGRLVLAYSAHGFLFTHAGLHAQFKYNEVPEGVKTNPAYLAKYINKNLDLERNGIVDAISRKRGGASDYGGILWRDASESLYPEFRQVFGHTSKPKIRRYQNQAGESYCIDVGDKDNGRLAGIWLPSEEIVEVDLSKKLDAT